MKTVFVLVDALKSLYLNEENMPFLYSLSKKGYYVKHIIPCSGFCERSEIFSGLDGYDTGNFTAIGYLPEYSPYKNDTLILSMAGIIDNKITRSFFSRWRLKNKRKLNPYRIPFKSLRYFALTEDGDARIIKHNDIFQELLNNGFSYTLDGFTSLSDLSIRSCLTPHDLLKREIKKQTDFIPLYLGVIDQVGHRYGADINKISPFLQEIDQLLEQMYYTSKNAGYAFCVLGDHGMVPVCKKVDIAANIAESGCKIHHDYEAFYDSTTARFWFRNNTSKEKIESILKEKLSQEGFIVTKDNCAQYRIPLDILNNNGLPIYGDLVWCAHPGVLISPDYFHSRNTTENGMHGYIEIIKGHGTGLFVKSYDGVARMTIEQLPSSSICSELCDLLGINLPNKNWRREL